MVKTGVGDADGVKDGAGVVGKGVGDADGICEGVGVG